MRRMDAFAAVADPTRRRIVELLGRGERAAGELVDEFDVSAPAGQGSVRFRRLLPGPIERVFEYLTDSKLRGTWFAGGTMELFVGGRVDYVFHESKLTLTHVKLAGRKEMVDVSAGWHAHLDVLRERLHGRAPARFWSDVERYDREYEARVPAERPGGSAP
jgi:hypothetical protein